MHPPNLEMNMMESNAAYAAHVKASEELHQAQVAMMLSKCAICALNDELTKASAATAAATELVDRRRKAADAASQDFLLTSQMTRACYGTVVSSKAPSSPVYHAISPSFPVYHPTPPMYSERVADASPVSPAAEDDEETQKPGGER